MFITDNLTRFKSLFVLQLKAMLADDQLGAFILVLANSLQDAELRAALKSALHDNFAVLKAAVRTGELQAPPDDMAVFKQLLELDIDQLPLWQSRQAGNWELALNSMRRLRPARASKEVLSSIIQPFDDSRFHFNKPFLQPEILWQGEYEGEYLRVLYNKFPFAPYHLLIALAPQDNLPQVMRARDHDYIFSLAASVAKIFRGFGIGYNSLGAGASVNHLHFQGFVREQAFAIEQDEWTHNGGNRAYPLMVQCFDAPAEAWACIQQLTAQDRAFNCLYRGGRCYVAPRQYQGAVGLPVWLDGAGWLDLAGVITVPDNETFERLDADAIAQALARLDRDA